MSINDKVIQSHLLLNISTLHQARARQQEKYSGIATKSGSAPRWIDSAALLLQQSRNRMTLVNTPDTENELENPDRAGSQNLDNIGSDVDNEQQVTGHSNDVPELSPTGLPSSNFFFEPADDSDELNGTALSTASTLVSSAEQPEKTLASLSGKRPGYRSSLSGSSNTMSSMTRPQLSIKRPSQSVQPLQTGSEEKKMHQTSTRIMRTTPDGRPFARVCTVLKFSKFVLT